MDEVDHILGEIERGDRLAPQRLLPLVYEELRRLAAHRLSRENPGHSLQATDLVHEAYLRLVHGENATRWESRGHFFAAAAEAMRRILVDAARRKLSARRGGRRPHGDLLDHDLVVGPVSDDILDLDDALRKLSAIDSRASELVQLRVFAGMTIDEVAQHLRISPRTANAVLGLCASPADARDVRAPNDRREILARLSRRFRITTALRVGEGMANGRTWSGDERSIFLQRWR
ncbi:MAG: ECF-type sigma factor [Isosphaeraceae bacterium]